MIIRRWGSSIFLGVLGFMLLRITGPTPETEIDQGLVLSFLFPLIASLAYGWKPALLSGTVLISLSLLFQPGFSLSDLNLCIGCVCLLWVILHGWLVSKVIPLFHLRLDPLVSHWFICLLIWISSRYIFPMDHPLIDVLAQKSVMILLYVLVAVLALLKYGPLRRILFLESDSAGRTNGVILVLSQLISAVACFILPALGRLFQINQSAFVLISPETGVTIAVFVYSGFGFLIGYLICGYAESRSRSEQQRLDSNRELIRKEEQISEISNNFTYGMIYQILYKSAEDRRFLYVSRSVEKLYGITVSEAMADPMKIYGRVYPDDVRSLIEKESEALRNMSAMRAVVRMINPDGTIRWSSFISTPKRQDDGSILWDGIEFDISEQKSIEHSLRIFKESVEESADAVGMSTPEGVHYYQNAAFTALFGEIGPNPPSTLYVDQDIGRQVFQTIKSGAGWIGEVRMYGRNRSVLDILLRAYAIFGDDGRIIGLAGLHTDITNRKSLENSLKVFKESVENSTDAITMSTPEGRHYYQNSAFTSIFGDIGHVPQDTFVNRAVADEVFTTIKAGGKWQGEVELYDRNRQVLFVLLRAYAIFGEDNRIIGLAGIHTDITERKQSELRLRQSEERLRALVDNAPFGAHLYELHDDGSLVLSGFNKSAEIILGIQLGHLIGKTIEDAFPGLRETGIPDEYRSVARTGRPFNRDQVIYESDELRGAYDVYAFHTGLNRMAVFFLDITQRKKTEEEKAKLQSQLIQIQKLESIGQLAGGIAHDFNNTVQTIIGNADLALNELDPTHPVQNELTEIIKAAERSAALTRQLLAFARKQPITPKVVDLNQSIEKTLSILSRLIGDEIELVWKPGSDLQPVKIDTSQLDQILTNLCINARDASRSKGSITIETIQQKSRSDTSVLPREALIDYLVLSVTDEGCGMDKETQSHIFEPFYTTKEAGRGTGLGLATVYGIVSQNNGFIDVTSKPGMGSTFRVFLPVYSGQIVEQPEKALDQPIRQGGAMILLVEDDPTILRVYQVMLEKLGYGVSACSVPSDAIQHAETHGDSIDLLMTDMVMPGMSGQSLANQIRSRFPGIKVLFMSGHSEDLLLQSPEAAIGIQFLQKPFSKKQLAEKLHGILS